MAHTEFNQEQFDLIYPLGIERHYWTLSRNFIIQKELERNGLLGKRLLEIGCGRGVVVDFLRQAGFDCCGVELAPIQTLPQIAPHIHSGIDITALDHTFADSVEIILLLDVLEHLPDDQEFLKTIRKIFPRAKYLIITVPARRELWSNYDSFYGHLRRYDLRTLGRVAEGGGWKTVSSRFYFHALYIPARLLLRFAGHRPTKIIPPEGLMVLVHKLLAFLFVLDFMLLPDRCPGTSIISILMAREDGK